MARSNAAAVIDFGSSTINVYIAEKGVNNTFNILGSSEMEYSGYLDGEFLNTAELFHVLGHAINSAEQAARMRISEVYVGVPGEFTTVMLKEPQITYPNKRKITDGEVEDLFKAGDTFSDNPDYKLINRSPIYFTSSDGRLLIDPKDIKTTKLSGQLSYVLAYKKFTDLVSQILAQYDIKRVEYVSSCLAESLYILDPYERDRYAILLDIGYTTTSVMIVRGEGLIYLKSFAVGGGHITADLFECFGMPYPIAEELKRKISLTFAVGENDEYEIETKEKTYKFKAEEAHKVVEARLDHIAKLVNKCLKLCDLEYPSYINLKLTGGGISYMRGAKEYLGKMLGKNVDLVKNPVPLIDSPHLSSTYAVLDLALKQRKNKNIIDRVFK